MSLFPNGPNHYDFSEILAPRRINPATSLMKNLTYQRSDKKPDHDKTIHSRAR